VTKVGGSFRACKPSKTDAAKDCHRSAKTAPYDCHSMAAHGTFSNDAKTLFDILRLDQKPGDSGTTGNVAASVINHTRHHKPPPAKPRALSKPGGRRPRPTNFMPKMLSAPRCTSGLRSSAFALDSLLGPHF
jgi:hypothetical protein